MPEGKDKEGYVWVLEQRDGEYYYLKDFEHLVVMKVANFSETFPKEHWEAVVFEDGSCRKIVGRQEFATKNDAQKSLEQLMEVIIKNRETK